MDLTEEEQRMLDGKNGKGCKFAIEILVEVGEAFGARRMVPVGERQECATLVLKGMNVLGRWARVRRFPPGISVERVLKGEG